MGSVLRLENLKYKNILKNITFSLEEKSFNILIGANGSGKTTIVNCIRGLNKYEGTINLFKNILNQDSDTNLYKNVGFFTDQELFLEENIFEELVNMLKNLNYTEDKAKKRIYSIAKKINVTELLFKKENELSSSQSLLMSFVFSIIHEPKLLIIDNDLEILDELEKTVIFEYIQNQKKLTTLFITNDSSYFYMADNLLFLKDGKIVLSGSLEKLIDDDKVFIKCGSRLPFLIDLSKKLILYDLLDAIQTDPEKLVNQIWK